MMGGMGHLVFDRDAFTEMDWGYSVYSVCCLLLFHRDARTEHGE